jgi:hypothetical protein
LSHLQKSNPTEQLLAERQTTHGDTHELTGLVIEVLRVPFVSFLYQAPQLSYDWTMVLSKLIRALFSPYHEDHWRDIIGYATLALMLVEKGKNDGSLPESTPTPKP